MTGRKILVIEDNALNLELTSDLLSAGGFVVSSAPTAEEGLQMAGEMLPDLVLMDWDLPGMSGLCAAQELKANPVTRHLIIVGLSAHAMKGDKELALHSGCDGYLTKPIDSRTLVETLTRFIASADSGPTTNTKQRNYVD